MGGFLFFAFVTWQKIFGNVTSVFFWQCDIYGQERFFRRCDSKPFATGNKRVKFLNREKNIVFLKGNSAVKIVPLIPTWLPTMEGQNCRQGPPLSAAGLFLENIFKLTSYRVPFILAISLFLPSSSFLDLNVLSIMPALLSVTTTALSSSSLQPETLTKLSGSDSCEES